MATDLKKLRGDRNDLLALLSQAEKLIKDNPTDPSFRESRDDVVAMLASTEESIAAAEAEIAKPVKAAENDTAGSPKDDSNGVKTQAGGTTQDTPKPATHEPQHQVAHVFQANEVVTVKRRGDGFVTAKILTATGPSNNRSYHVRYNDTKDTAYVSAAQMRPINTTQYNPDSKKRKFEADPAPVPSNVISKAASIKPEFANQGKSHSDMKATDGPVRPAKAPRKLQNQRNLDKKKNAWQEFAKNNPKTNKESMFRTGEGLNARVGVTGSGKGMTALKKREKHVFKISDEEE